MRRSIININQDIKDIIFQQIDEKGAFSLIYIFLGLGSSLNSWIDTGVYTSKIQCAI